MNDCQTSFSIPCLFRNDNPFYTGMTKNAALRQSYNFGAFYLNNFHSLPSLGNHLAYIFIPLFL